MAIFLQPMRCFGALLITMCLTSFAFAEAKETQAIKNESEQINPSENKDKKIQFDLKQVSLQVTQKEYDIKIEASGGLNQAEMHVLSNPARLYVKLPGLQNKTGKKVLIKEFSDGLLIPRARISETEGALDLVIDTVLDAFPSYQTVQKTDHLIQIHFSRQPENTQEAKNKANIFQNLQSEDRLSLLKVGSQQAGGVLNDPNSIRSGETSQTQAGKEGLVQTSPAATGKKNQIILLLDDRKNYKIFLEDNQNSEVQIQKIRPSYEVKGIQKRLDLLGYSPGPADADLGPQTKQAIKQYQKDKGLKATGSPNKATQRALKEEFGY